jgi:hypothetical protein
MSKGIITKIAVILIVSGLVYSVFWFFKTGQVQKQINNFIQENGSSISAGEVSISGYPMSQKITIKDLKFTIPNPAIKKYQFTAKSLEIKSGIFSSDFDIKLTDQLFVQDDSGNNGYFEFSQDPQITLSIASGAISKFSYQDSGYRILDAEKNVAIASSASSIMVEMALDQSEKKSYKIAVNLNDMEGFDIINIYKNSAEAKIINGLKTGEISIGNSSSSLTDQTLVQNDQSKLAAEKVELALAGIPDPKASAIIAKAAGVAADKVAANPNVIPSHTVTAEIIPVSTTDSNIAPSSVTLDKENASVVVENNNLIKNNIVIDVEYVLTPIEQRVGGETSLDPTQMQEASLEYNRSVKINNIEFSNPLYKIAINGQADIFLDDNLPSGAITVKVDGIKNFVNYITSALTKITTKQDSGAEVQSSDLSTKSSSDEMIYHNFLNKMTSSLEPVVFEFSTKNQLSKDNLAVFDVRREKNIEFIVNETPFREILGKF